LLLPWACAKGDGRPVLFACIRQMRCHSGIMQPYLAVLALSVDRLSVSPCDSTDHSMLTTGRRRPCTCVALGGSLAAGGPLTGLRARPSDPSAVCCCRTVKGTHNQSRKATRATSQNRQVHSRHRSLQACSQPEVLRRVGVRVREL
jgi:hypothetical protein